VHELHGAEEGKPYIDKMAKEKLTHYEVLGVGPSVSQKEIKDAYRALVKSSHPDVDYQNHGKRNEATRQMTRLNEAYETLKDKRRRAEYDTTIGVNKQRSSPKVKLDENDTVESRERFLKRVFHPARSTMVKVLGKYKHELKKLSEDIYDDLLVSNFDGYLDSVENALRKAADAYSSERAPSSLEPAVHMMRHAIAFRRDAPVLPKLQLRSFDDGGESVSHISRTEQKRFAVDAVNVASRSF
jgi:molecular chaperone DnaJ